MAENKVVEMGGRLQKRIDALPATVSGLSEDSQKRIFSFIVTVAEAEAIRRETVEA